MVMSSSRVLVLSQLPPPVHGSTIVTSQLLDALRGTGFDAAITDRRFSTSVDEVGRFSVRKLSAAPHLLARFVGQLLLRRPAACIYFVTNRKFSALVDWSLIEALRALQVPYVLYVHTNGYENLRKRSALWNFLLRRQFGGATRVVVLGDSLRADVARLSRQIQVIENATAVPASIAASSDSPPHDMRHRVLYFSNLIPEKGAVTFAQMASALIGAGHDAEFLLHGAAGDQDTVDSVRQLCDEVGSGLSYRGPLGQEKWDVLRHTDMLVFPSTYPYEAQPLTIIEAMSAGVAVVAYDVGGISDLVEDGVNGILVPAADTLGLTAAVASLLEDSDRLVALQRGARARFLSRHTASEYRRKWTELLRQVGAQPDGPHREL